MRNPIVALFALVLAAVAAGLAWYIMRPGPTGVPAGVQGDDALAGNRLKQIAVGVMSYAQDWNNHLPPMQNSATLQEYIEPNVRDPKAFTDPQTGGPFGTNPTLSGKVLNDPDVVMKVLAYQTKPDGKGERRVAFVSGIVQTMDEAEWAKAKSESGIP